MLGAPIGVGIAGGWVRGYDPGKEGGCTGIEYPACCEGGPDGKGNDGAGG